MLSFHQHVWRQRHIANVLTCSLLTHSHSWVVLWWYHWDVDPPFDILKRVTFVVFDLISLSCHGILNLMYKSNVCDLDISLRFPIEFSFFAKTIILILPVISLECLSFRVQHLECFRIRWNFQLRRIMNYYFVASW